MTQIRDPIHGTIEVDRTEVRVIDHPFFQRLRHVKQLGFGDQAFPGATHTRYVHSLGAHHLASRVFDAVFRSGALPAADRRRFRRALRLAVLLHDLGHPPFSHSSERLLPPRADLGLGSWLPAEQLAGRASHEDYTLRILVDSDLSRLLDDILADEGLSAAAIAFLVTGRPSTAGKAFFSDGLDYGPVLRQMVSSELDADRMDYLLRDSFYTGAAYGRFDLDWVVQNLTCRVEGDAVYLGLSSRAIFAFEDFLLSRYHMFVSVYYHYKSICYDYLLGRYFTDSPGEYVIPGDPEGFLDHDDVHLWGVLRRSSSEWAQRIVRRDPYRLLVEVNPMDRGLDPGILTQALSDAAVPHFEAESRGELSKYFGRDRATTPIYVVPPVGPHRRVDEYTPLYRRYQEKLSLYRVYCHPQHYEQAREVLAAVGPDENAD